MNVEIKELPQATQMAFQAFGVEPESQAWQKLEQWVKEKNFPLEENSEIYGFNNPDPTAGNQQYGYEFRLTLPEDFKAAAKDEIINYPGGKYSTASFVLKTGEEIPKAWAILSDWFESSEYKKGNHQWLERHNIKGMPVELFFPIR
ncbi:MAG: effector binding domain-containing protein [Spirochaetaceae bacterium]|jgi:AraC family transcriptional regulator|nr:effector binding domain-containing protein [Spirochaetaceae bacterium]